MDGKSDGVTSCRVERRPNPAQVRLQGLRNHAIVQAVYLKCAEQGLLTKHQASAQLWPYIAAKVAGAA